MALPLKKRRKVGCEVKNMVECAAESKGELLCYPLLSRKRALRIRGVGALYLANPAVSGVGHFIPLRSTIPAAGCPTGRDHNGPLKLHFRVGQPDFFLLNVTLHSSTACTALIEFWGAAL